VYLYFAIAHRCRAEVVEDSGHQQIAYDQEASAYLEDLLEHGGMIF
jgi:hypothetical protein